MLTLACTQRMLLLTYSSASPATVCEEHILFYLGCAVLWFQGKKKRVKIRCFVNKSLFLAVLAAGVLKRL
eukprot:817049-Pelagomonas_calceolata.AAC.1